ncbi:hypothetical protein D5S17_28980 [Pseudonocardiaceae bacterium YIM PH 21723]|nr:hypothetical protein D5S17_28980 [Pseudonocardiaceae bacterium YIM PH 21723]
MGALMNTEQWLMAANGLVITRLHTGEVCPVAGHRVQDTTVSVFPKPVLRRRGLQVTTVELNLEAWLVNDLATGRTLPLVCDNQTVACQVAVSYHLQAAQGGLNIGDGAAVSAWCEWVAQTSDHISYEP